MGENVKIVFILALLVGVLVGCVSSQSLKNDYIAKNPNLSEKEKQAILNERIYVGMPANSVIASWGRPYKTTKRLSEYGNSETWYYGYYYRYWRTSNIVYLRQDDGGVYRVVNITSFDR